MGYCPPPALAVATPPCVARRAGPRACSSLSRHVFLSVLHHRSPSWPGQPPPGITVMGGRVRRGQQSPRCPPTRLAQRCQSLPPRAVAPSNFPRLPPPDACASPAIPPCARPSPCHGALRRRLRCQHHQLLWREHQGGSWVSCLRCWCVLASCDLLLRAPCCPTARHNTTPTTTPSPFTPLRVASSPAPPVTKSGLHA